MRVGLIVRKCHAALWASDCDQSVRAERLEPWLWMGNIGSSKGPATGSCSCVHYGPSSFSSLWLVPSLHKDTVLPQRLYFSFSCQLCFPLQYCWEVTQFVISCTGVLSVSFCVLWGGSIRSRRWETEQVITTQTPVSIATMKSIFLPQFYNSDPTVSPEAWVSRERLKHFLTYLLIAEF